VAHFSRLYLLKRSQPYEIEGFAILVRKAISGGAHRKLPKMTGRRQRVAFCKNLVFDKAIMTAVRLAGLKQSVKTDCHC